MITQCTKMTSFMKHILYYLDILDDIVTQGISTLPDDQRLTFSRVLSTDEQWDMDNAMDRAKVKVGELIGEKKHLSPHHPVIPAKKRKVAKLTSSGSSGSGSGSGTGTGTSPSSPKPSSSPT